MISREALDVYLNHLERDLPARFPSAKAEDLKGLRARIESFKQHLDRLSDQPKNSSRT